MARRRKQPPPYEYAGEAGKHVRLDEWLLGSVAWQHATPAARCLLIELLRLHNGSNNGSIFMSAREAGRRLGTTKNTGGAKLRELQTLGFIKPVQRGAFNIKGGGSATVWILTMYGVPGQPRPTKEFMSWRPSNAAGRKKKLVSKSDTPCPSQGDRQSKPRSKIDTGCIENRYREAPSKASDCPKNRYTDTSTTTVNENDASDSATKQSPSKQQQRRDQPSYTLPSPGTHQPARHQKQPRLRDPRQVDIEDLCGRPSSSSSSPLDLLRSEIQAHLDGAPRGSQSKLARAAGMQPCSLTNFLKGKDGLSSARATALKEQLANARASST